MIKPHFEYGSTILFTCCTAHQIGRLQKLQLRAMRIILNVNRCTSIHFMMESLKQLNVEQRLKLNTQHFIRITQNGETPEYITEQVLYVRNSQPYHLSIERVASAVM